MKNSQPIPWKNYGGNHLWQLEAQDFGGVSNMELYPYYLIIL